MSVPKDAQEQFFFEDYLAAAQRGDIPYIQKGLNQGLDIDTIGGPFLATLLQEAIEHNEPDLVEFLIMRGADINRHTESHTFRYSLTPIELAFRSCFHLTCVELLMRQRADLSTPNLLSIAIKFAPIPAIRLLLNTTPAFKEQIRSKEPITWARSNQRDDVAEWLLAYGAETTDEINNTQEGEKSKNSPRTKS